MLSHKDAEKANNINDVIVTFNNNYAGFSPQLANDFLRLMYEPQESVVMYETKKFINNLIIIPYSHSLWLNANPSSFNIRKLNL